MGGEGGISILPTLAPHQSAVDRFQRFKSFCRKVLSSMIAPSCSNRLLVCSILKEKLIGFRVLTGSAQVSFIEPTVMDIISYLHPARYIHILTCGPLLIIVKGYNPASLIDMENHSASVRWDTKVASCTETEGEFVKIMQHLDDVDAEKDIHG
ncbi:hypothetical protein Tsp_03810, partial [Trichinella spiralis]|uniref:hypothetical protein n=1 Tax=Trichinella spiralis TaxID=6334 RepID=UPI0001EFC0E9